MKNPHLPTVPRNTKKLDRARQRLVRWRSTHQIRARIPEELWTLITEIAREYGVGQTVRLLGLDYYSVKKRVEAASAGVEQAAFVELAPTVGDINCEWAVEVEHQRGTRMRIQCKCGNSPDLVELSERLWRAVR